MTTPQEAARTALARVLPSIDLRYSDGSGFGPGLDGAMFEDHEADHWADALLAALQADPDAARAVVALLGGEGLEAETLAEALWNADAKAAGWMRPQAPFKGVTTRARTEILERATAVIAELDHLARLRGGTP